MKIQHNQKYTEITDITETHTTYTEYKKNVGNRYICHINLKGTNKL